MPVVPAQGGQDAAQPFGVGEAAQVVHTGQAGAGDVQAARLGAGGQQQLVVDDQGAVAEADGPGAGVQVDGGLAQVQLDLCLGVPGRFMDEDTVALFLAEQVPLGERGRSYGWSRSSQMRITRPVKPSARSVSAAFAPTRPPPTMTNVWCASTTCFLLVAVPYVRVRVRERPHVPRCALPR